MVLLSIPSKKVEIGSKRSASRQKTFLTLGDCMKRARAQPYPLIKFYFEKKEADLYPGDHCRITQMGPIVMIKQLFPFTSSLK
ncbi:MAG: hypothetical protein WAM14_00335 [Candidatus Nitrosopolaris sp.]